MSLRIKVAEPAGLRVLRSARMRLAASWFLFEEVTLMNRCGDI